MEKMKEIIKKPWKFSKEEIINEIKEVVDKNQDIFNYSLKSDWNKEDISTNSNEMIKNTNFNADAALISANFYYGVLKNKDLLNKDFIVNNMQTIYYLNYLIY